jgi:8-amino-7-oxononanoate synthase
MVNDYFLEEKLAQRASKGALRTLKPKPQTIDFSSNDYLGVVRNGLIQMSHEHAAHGSTGSRLLTGNSLLAEQVETGISRFHDGEAALIFNSGYDANIGLLGCVPVKGDTIIYDFLSHASIRDGIRLSAAQSFSFLHNDTADLERRLRVATGNVFVVTESVFSMDGDMAPLEVITALCGQYNAYLIVDEAHATGVIGDRGEGLVQALRLQSNCFARIYTFGKALGCHGAVVVGSARLRNFLINFSRAFIYTTALPASAIYAIGESYRLIPSMVKEREKLLELIAMFQSANLPQRKLVSITPIQAVVVPGNENVKMLSSKLDQLGLDVRPILYPTVPKGAERLRIVLHSFNSERDVEMLIEGLK